MKTKKHNSVPFSAVHLVFRDDQTVLRMWRTPRGVNRAIMIKSSWGDMLYSCIG